MDPRIITVMLFLKILFVSTNDEPAIYGLLPDHYESLSDNIFVLHANKNVRITLFGLHLQRVTHIAFASVKKTAYSSCEQERNTNSYAVKSESEFVSTGVITLRELSKNEDRFFLCMRVLEIGSDNVSDSSKVWKFAGSESADYPMSFRTTKRLMPLWLQIILVSILFLLSGLFSGLNLGLMALDKTELKIIETAGDHHEKAYAKAIRPVREKGNLLLCTLLLGNVLVNNTLTILMDDLTGNGLFAVIASTAGITLLGEIMPQAVCSRHGLAIGAKTIWMTKLFMLLTFPIAFPLSFVLDKILGKEMGQAYTREKLGVLIREQTFAGTVATDEMNIMTGALAITTKTVADVMTPLSDAFMLSYSAILDFTTMNEIFAHGYTRIPVYEGDRHNIRAVLNVKDLAFINTEDKIPVSTICDFYNRSIIIVLDSTNLETMLKEFRQGRAHMAFVERLVTDGEGDPYREMIGLVTLEDVIEEIIQAEIVDETDILTDNVHHQHRPLRKRDFRMFNLKETQTKTRLSPQLKITALQHLTSNLESFNEKYISYSILQSFLNANVVCEFVFNSKDEENNLLYHTKQWANYSILILEGRAIIEIGSEGLLFEVGPFVMFGETVLKRVNEIFPVISATTDLFAHSTRLANEAKFLPDYTLKAVTNLKYLKVTAEQYLLARKLSVLHHRHYTSNPEALRMSLNTFDKNGEYRSSNPFNSTAEIHDLFQKAWNSHLDCLQKSSISTNVDNLLQDKCNNDAILGPDSIVTNNSSNLCNQPTATPEDGDIDVNNDDDVNNDNNNNATNLDGTNHKRHPNLNSLVYIKDKNSITPQETVILVQTGNQKQSLPNHDNTCTTNNTRTN